MTDGEELSGLSALKERKVGKGLAINRASNLTIFTQVPSLKNSGRWSIWSGLISLVLSWQVSVQHLVLPLLVCHHHIVTTATCRRIAEARRPKLIPVKRLRPVLQMPKKHSPPSPLAEPAPGGWFHRRSCASAIDVTCPWRAAAVGQRAR